MCDVDPTILDAARARGCAVLDQRGDISDYEVFGNTRKHLIIKARDSAGDALCLKVALTPVGEETPAASIKAELAAFALFDADTYWAPKLRDASEAEGWLLRTWVGTGTSNEFPSEAWDKARLDQFWTVFADAFAVFHDAETPLLMRDIKPTNVCFDEAGFYLFDFNTVKSLKIVRGVTIRSRLGTRSNLYASPETLIGDFSDIDVSADFFGFASIFHRFAVGRNDSIWTNAEKDIPTALQCYQDEYAALCPAYAEALAAHGYTDEQSAFLIACLNPVASERPARFLRP